MDNATLNKIIEHNRMLELHDIIDECTCTILNGVRSLHSKTTLKANYKDFKRWIERLDLAKEELDTHYKD